MMETHNNSPHSVAIQVPPKASQIEAESLLKTSVTMQLPPPAPEFRDTLQSQTGNASLNFEDQKPSASLLVDTGNTKTNEVTSSVQVATASLLSIHKELRTRTEAAPNVHCSNATSNSTASSPIKASLPPVKPSSPTLVWKDLTVPEAVQDKPKPELPVAKKPSKKRKKRSPPGVSTGRWTAAEHEAFLQGLAIYGREWKRVAADIPTRTSAQVRSHAQKYFSKLAKQQEEGNWMQHETVPNPDAPKESPVVSESVRRETMRIMSDPSSVESEVRETMEKLRRRYCELQEKLRRRHARHDNGSVGSDINSVENDELIAVHVLQGGLQPIRHNNHNAANDNNDDDGDENHP